MAYSSGGLISATDFNGLATTNTSNIGWMWGTGYAQWGYGQSTTLLTSVSAGATVTATQWAGLIYTLNKALAHQGQTTLGGGPLGANINMTAGQTITYFANVGTAITQINTTGNAYYASGTTITGTNFTAAMSFAGSAVSYSFNTARTVTFAGGADAARYFFNAGGRLQLVITATNNNATARSADFVTLLQTNLGGGIVFQNSSTGRTGSSGTLTSSNTTAGYYTLSTTPTTYANLTPGSATYTYINDWVRLNVNSNNPQGTNGDRGSTITFNIDSATPAQTNSNFNDAVDVTVTTRIDIIPPETTYLGNVWGVIGIT